MTKKEDLHNRVLSDMENEFKACVPNMMEISVVLSELKDPDDDKGLNDATKAALELDKLAKKLNEDGIDSIDIMAAMSYLAIRAHKYRQDENAEYSKYCRKIEEDFTKFKKSEPKPARSGKRDCMYG